MGEDTCPLLTHPTPSAVVAYRRGKAVTAAQFLAAARELSVRLPAGRHVINVCSDRYHFTLALAACLITQRVSLLPSTHTPQVILQLVEFAPDVYCVTDDPACSIGLPIFQVPDLDGREATWDVPHIARGQVAAIVFTSGTTGTPVPYRKTWGKLTQCVRGEAALLGLDDGAAHTLIGTVPAQHMYGFETTVLLALQSGNAFSAERPFYPADIGSAVAAVPRPRALIATPVHLRALLAANVAVPPLELIVSATAPLAESLARHAETTFQTRLMEIYGSTETGQIAIRRTATSPYWRLWPGVRLEVRGGQAYAHGGHVEQLTALCDVIELKDGYEFLLQGRTADLVNVAGKRSSFGFLDAQLNAIPGVVDGAFFFRDAEPSGATGVKRLAAVAVAPGMTEARLIEQLRRRIDPVFLPRPLVLVERLPRNATGKLPRSVLEALAEDAAGTGGIE